MLAGCGGGSGIATRPVTTLPATTSGASPTAAIVNGKVAQPFSLLVASASGVAKIGIASSAESGSPEHDVAVAGGATGCTAVSTGRQCAFSLTLPWGPQTLTVTTYGPRTLRTQMKVALGGTRIALATGTAIAQISLDLQDAFLSTNSAGTTKLYVTARDAAGNAIIGPFGGTIALASSDTSGAISLATSSVAASTDSPVTVNYSGAVMSGPVTFSATSSGVPASSITSASLAFTAPQVMYEANQGDLQVYPLTAQLGNIVPLRRISIANYIIYEAYPDGAGNLLLLASQTGAFTGMLTHFPYTFFKVPIGASGAVTPTPFGISCPTGTGPLDFGTDAIYNVVVLCGNYATTLGTIMIFPPGGTSPIRTISGSLTQFGNASGGLNGLTVAPDGTIAINIANPNDDLLTTWPGSILIFGPSAAGNIPPTRTLSGPATGLTSAGIDIGEAYPAWMPDGSLAVSDIDYTGAASLRIFAPGASGNATPVRVIAGNATGLDVGPALISGARPTQDTVYAQDGLSVDSQGRLYVAVFGSSLGLPGQFLRFDPSATGNVPPSAVLAGNFTGLRGTGKLSFGPSAITAPSATVPSVGGDFLAVTANRGWNYAVTPGGTGQTAAAPPFTLTMYADPVQQSGDTVLVALQQAGVHADATAGSIGAYASVNSATGGYTATGYYSVSNFAGGPIPGGLQLVLPSLTKGQTWTPYAGLTATVLEVGSVPGAGACPGGTASIGATVLYSYGYSGIRISYVPGCGITHMVTSNGTQFLLTSIGSYPTLSELAHARRPASLDIVNALRKVWGTVFAPWHAQ